jgi:hypothetical protein
MTMHEQAHAAGNSRGALLRLDDRPSDPVLRMGEPPLEAQWRLSSDDNPAGIGVVPHPALTKCNASN